MKDSVVVLRAGGRVGSRVLVGASWGPILCCMNRYCFFNLLNRDHQYRESTGRQTMDTKGFYWKCEDLPTRTPTQNKRYAQSGPTQ